MGWIYVVERKEFASIHVSVLIKCNVSVSPRGDTVDHDMVVVLDEAPDSSQRERLIGISRFYDKDAVNAGDQRS